MGAPGRSASDGFRSPRPWRWKARPALATYYPAEELDHTRAECPWADRGFAFVLLGSESTVR